MAGGRAGAGEGGRERVRPAPEARARAHGRPRPEQAECATGRAARRARRRGRRRTRRPAKGEWFAFASEQDAPPPPSRAPEVEGGASDIWVARAGSGPRAGRKRVLGRGRGRGAGHRGLEAQCACAGARGTSRAEEEAPAGPQARCLEVRPRERAIRFDGPLSRPASWRRLESLGESVGIIDKRAGRGAANCGWGSSRQRNALFRLPRNFDLKFAQILLWKVHGKTAQ